MRDPISVLQFQFFRVFLSMYCYIYLSISPNDIYHVTVMPCYDKKLEASREDFYNDLYRTRDVDCVITSGEGRGSSGRVPYDIIIIAPLYIQCIL